MLEGQLFPILKGFKILVAPIGQKRKFMSKIMTRAFHSCIETAKKYEVHNRMGAYIVAVERVAKAMKIRGWI